MPQTNYIRISGGGTKAFDIFEIPQEISLCGQDCKTLLQRKTGKLTFNELIYTILDLSSLGEMVTREAVKRLHLLRARKKRRGGEWKQVCKISFYWNGVKQEENNDFSSQEGEGISFLKTSRHCYLDHLDQENRYESSMTRKNTVGFSNQQRGKENKQEKIRQRKKRNNILSNSKHKIRSKQYTQYISHCIKCKRRGIYHEKTETTHFFIK